MSEELRKCPFCGGRPHIILKWGLDNVETRYCIEHTCKGEMPYMNIQSAGYTTIKQAAEKWNERK